MLRAFRSIVGLVPFSAALLCVPVNASNAGDHFRREPTISHGCRNHCRYTRDANHGLIHYPCATYWASGNAVDRWDTNSGAQGSYSSYDITPSPWAYRSIAPYAHQYHSFKGTGFCISEAYDCRN